MISEDSNSGYEFFEKLPGKSSYHVLAAGGKSKIFEKTLSQAGRCLLVIADGAAFGAEADRMMKLIQHEKNIVLYLPESFEWLILKSGVIKHHNLNQILEHPENYAESSLYFSWERFFTSLLINIAKDSCFVYTKRKLNPVYLQRRMSDKITAVMEGIALQDNDSAED